MKKRRLKLSSIILLLLVLFIPTYLFLQNLNKKYSPKVDNDFQYDLEDVYEEFIEEEVYIPEEEIEIHLSGWIAYWDFYNALETYKNNTERIETLSPTWYYLNPDGTLGLKNTARNSELVSLDVRLIPTISNSNADELSNVLNNAEILDAHVNSIINEVNTYNYDGIDIDYENIKETDKDSFSNFVEKLSQKLHEHRKVLTIAILWKNDLEPILGEFSESRKAQDWERIGQSVDEFRIMAYNYTNSTGQAGPIAPKEWIESILSFAVKKVDEEKIVLGLPFYAYEWSEGAAGAKALVWTDVSNIKSSTSNIISDELNVSYLEKELKYKSGATTKVIWYQDSKVTEERIELAKKYEVYKFIFWRLGGEDPETWNL